MTHITKDLEIISSRISTLNEHINNQKEFIDSKFQETSEHDRRLLNIEKEINLFKSSFHEMLSSVQDQIENINRTKSIGGESSLKEFGDLIKDKMANFFDERKNQFQKMEIQLDELKNLDTVKQNVIIRLQKEFSERLTGVNQRLSEQKISFSEQILNTENFKRQLLDLEKAIHELRKQLHGKKTDLFSQQDLRLQSIEDRFQHLTTAIDKRVEETDSQSLEKILGKQDKEINYLNEEISKLKNFIALDKTSSKSSDSTGDLENQMKDLKGMVYSLINSLKE